MPLPTASAKMSFRSLGLITLLPMSMMLSFNINLLELKLLLRMNKFYLLESWNLEHSMRIDMIKLNLSGNG